MKNKMKLLVFAILMSAFSPNLFAQTTNQDFRKLPPPSLKPIAFNLPKPFEMTLKNGLKVVIIEDKSLPLVNYKLAFQFGDINDPANLTGINVAVAGMLEEGTKNRDSKQIADEIEKIGARISAYSTADNVIVSGSTLSLYKTDVLQLMADMALNPSFPKSELDILKSRIIESLKFKRSLPGFLVEEQFNKILYGKHPYSIIAPTAEDIGKLSQTDLIAFHKSNYTPNQATLIAVGNVDRNDFLKQVEELFGKWESKKLTEMKFATPPARNEKTITIVDRPGSAQSNIVLANLAIDRKHPDYFSVLVLNQVLGGGGSARLFLNLREDKGYTYGAYSTIYAQHQAGTFALNAEVRTPVTGDSLKEFFIEINRIRKDDVSVSEMNGAKDFLTGSFPISSETQEDLSHLILDQQIYNLPNDYLQTYREKISAVTPADVKRVANKYLKADSIAIVIVGDAGEILPQVQTYAKSINVFDTEGVAIELSKYDNSNIGEPSDINGKWILTLSILGQEAGQELTVNVDFKQDGDKLTGEIASQIGNGNITSGKVTGNRFTAVVKVEDAEQSIDVTINGTIDGDSMNATISIPASPQPLPFTGIRIKQK